MGAVFVRGRVCQGPSLLGAEMSRNHGSEACIGVLRIQDNCHFTSRDIGYCPFYFQGYGILCSIFSLLSGILNI